MQDTLLDKIKNYVFPAKKVLDKAAAQGDTSKQETVTTPSDADPLYLQKIVNERMKEKMTTPNPLENVLKNSSKNTPKNSVKNKMNKK
jgi:hypothetical protein